MSDIDTIKDAKPLSEEEHKDWKTFAEQRKADTKNAFVFYSPKVLPFTKSRIAKSILLKLVDLEDIEEIEREISSLELLTYAQPFSISRLFKADVNKSAMRDIALWLKVGKDIGISDTAFKKGYGLMMYHDPNGKMHDINRNLKFNA